MMKNEDFFHVATIKTPSPSVADALVDALTQDMKEKAVISTETRWHHTIVHASGDVEAVKSWLLDNQVQVDVIGVAKVDSGHNDGYRADIQRLLATVAKWPAWKLQSFHDKRRASPRATD